jgi:16S rRNA (cytosine967-C5)-methyltransferase
VPGRALHKAQSSGTPRTPQAISPARAAASEILTRIGAGKGHSDELLHSSFTSTLSPEDRNLTTALVMGVLRWQIALDAQIASLLSRPGQKLAEPVAISLRLGAFQLLHMDRIPAHAALNESVELCRAAGQPHAAGMVNAILRKFTQAAKASPKLYELPAAFAERLAHPRWLVERWAAAYGRDAALAICEYDQQEPPPSSLFRDSSTEIHSLPEIDDGSRLVAEIAAAALSSQTNTPRVWDACAAPGGKTLVLAARLPEADILATDISARRLAAMKRRIQHYSYANHVRYELADASSKNVAESNRFDLILCDVPCSGTGTLARNPEIRLKLHANELQRQAGRQQAILHNALQQLAPGGHLVYSTCSLEPEENEAVLKEILSSTPVQQRPVQPIIQHLANSGLLPQDDSERLIRTAIRNDALRTLPGVHPCDGFYVSILQRNN